MSDEENNDDVDETGHDRSTVSSSGAAAASTGDSLPAKGSALFSGGAGGGLSHTKPSVSFHADCGATDGSNRNNNPGYRKTWI